MSTGRYTCRARVQGFTDVFTSVEIFMKGPPRITRTERIQFGRIGDNVEITCDTFSIPQPNQIEWRQYDQNYPIPLPSSHYRVTFRFFVLLITITTNNIWIQNWDYKRQNIKHFYFR